MVRKILIVKLCLMLLTIATIPVPSIMEEAMGKHKETNIVQKHQAMLKKLSKSKEKSQNNIKIIEHQEGRYNSKELDPIALKQKAFVKSRFFSSSYLESLSLASNI